MANDSMVVMAAVARKGGSGKSILVKSLASAALAGGKSVLVIDTDPQRDVARWFRRAEANGLVPATASLRTADSTAELEALIHGAYEAGDVDFILIDTAGVGGSWTDQIAMLSDHLLTPVVASVTDFEVGTQTVDWFRRLHDRVPDPSQLPPHHVVLTQFPARPSKLETALLKEAVQAFPLLNSVVQHRNAYREMDSQGFLGEIVRRLNANPNPLQRSHARRFQEALVESTYVLNDILAA